MGGVSSPITKARSRAARDFQARLPAREPDGSLVRDAGSWDGFGVVEVQGDGVFAGFEVDLDVPDEDGAGGGSGD